jgi:4-cresol dehydrogenase (hydroxylating)
MNATDTFFAEVEKELGVDSVNRSDETIRRYGENTMPGGDKRPAGVVYPSSTAQIQMVVRLANKYKVPLYPVSTGQNIGLGSRSAPREGQIVVDLGFKMNRILEIDEKLAFAVVEPGVSYQNLYDELVRRGNKLMLDVTSGPPQGGMIGNALDKGAGYTPYFDHFGFSCGLEIVLGSGEILRTGDGALDSDTLANWHTSKYSFGPILDGLFAQSNYGIVTRMGIWLLPKPPAVRSFHFAFPDDSDLEQIIDLCRPLKLSNFVPTLFRVANDLYLCGSEGESAEYAASKGKRSINDEGRKALQKKHGLGAWNVSGAFYGPSMQALDPMIQRVADHFGQSKKATYIPHEDAAKIPPLQVARRTWSAEVAARWRQYLVPAWHPDGWQGGKRIPDHLPRHLRRLRDGLHGDECLRSALRPRPACHDLQSGRRRRAGASRRMLSQDVGRGRQARCIRRPRSRGLS